MASRQNEFLDQLPEGYEIQAQEMSRQQKLAELLMAKGMQQPQGEMVSGRFVKPSFLQQLVPMANMLASQSIGGRADEQRAKIAQMIRSGRAKAEDAIIDQLTPRQEIMEMSGPYGMSGGGRNVPMPTATRDIEPDYSQAARLIRNNPYGAGKEFLPQVIKNLAPEQTTAMQEFNYGLKRPEFANFELQKRAASAPRNSTTAITNVQAYEPFNNKTQGEMASALVKNFDMLKDIPTQIETLSRVKELAPTSFAGSLATQKLDAAKFLNNNLGLNIAKNKIVNTEELNTVLFTNIMDNLKKMDAQPSQMQQIEMKKGLGNIGTDPDALPKVIDVYTRVLEGKAREHNRRVKETASGPSGTKFAYDITIPLRSNAPSGSGGGSPGEVDFNSLKPKR